MRLGVEHSTFVRCFSRLCEKRPPRCDQAGGQSAPQLRLSAQQAYGCAATHGRAKDSAAHTLRWASEFSQRENCHPLVWVNKRSIKAN